MLAAVLSGLLHILWGWAQSLICAKHILYPELRLQPDPLRFSNTAWILASWVLMAFLKMAVRAGVSSQLFAEAGTGAGS